MSIAGYRAMMSGASPRKTRRKPRQLEAEHQARVVLWCRQRYAEAPDLWPDLDSLFCSMAGVKLTKVQAGIAKGQGNRPGAFDLILLVPRGKYHGLLIEMKEPSNGRESPEQKKEALRLTRLGYLATVCYGYDAAIKTITDYYRS
jgi:hypothetical protein